METNKPILEVEIDANRYEDVRTAIAAYVKEYGETTLLHIKVVNA